jgi:N-acetylmuramic acid 6-phosphate etherase
MTAPRTEQADERYRGIDTWSSQEVLSAIASAQREAIEAVVPAIAALARVGEAIAGRMRGGGRLVYVGAGSSGLLAKVDALELPDTYGIPADRVPVLMAGGPAALLEIPNGAEDDAAAGERDVEALGLDSRDCVLAVSASGGTPYTLAALLRAKALGALTVAIASNAGTPLLDEADHPIHIATPPEVVAGSTRMNAGTAQKCALNMLSTLVGIRLGHAYEGLMVNLRAENAKLRDRAVGIVGKAAGVDAAASQAALEKAGGAVKTAILIAAGAETAAASELIERCQGDVRAALREFTTTSHKAG